MKSEFVGANSILVICSLNMKTTMELIMIDAKMRNNTRRNTSRWSPNVIKPSASSEDNSRFWFSSLLFLLSNFIFVGY